MCRAAISVRSCGTRPPFDGWGTCGHTSQREADDAVISGSAVFFVLNIHGVYMGTLRGSSID